MRRRATDVDVVPVVGFAAMYVPLLVVSAARPATFIYYMLPAVPFMGLAIAAVVRGWPVQRATRAMLAFSACAVATLAFFYPVLTAQPLSEREVAARQWFRDCDAPAQHAPPVGWCWR